MIDKNYCMSSYLAFRFIERNDMDFYPEMHHEAVSLTPDEERIPVRTAGDIDRAIAAQIAPFEAKKKGVLLSGGMDSAIIASYLPGAEAYTFRFLGGHYQKEELNRAEYYADYYGLHLHYVDISWEETVLRYLTPVMRAKCAPVHSIEPQLYQAAMQAKADGVEVLFSGEGSDSNFGGLDGLLSQDWTFDAFMDRYIFTKPEAVLKEPVSMQYLFERFRRDGDKIDFLGFMDYVYCTESTGSYLNPLHLADLPYYTPYAYLKMAKPLDLDRIRRGESKYLIRELMAQKYPDIPVPEKLPMPRPVDQYFASWKGPVRPEFREDIDLKSMNGNQKWQLYCLEAFLNMAEGRA